MLLKELKKEVISSAIPKEEPQTPADADEEEEDFKHEYATMEGAIRVSGGSESN